MKKTQKLKILVCEADVAVLSRLESWLNTIVEEVITTVDGVEALEIVKNSLPDIVLLSQNIKNIKAIELIKKIKKIVKKQAIIFVVDDDVSSLKMAITLQVDKYLNFPVEEDSLLNTIESLSKEKLRCKEIKSQKRLLQDYKDAIDLSFSVSRHDKDGNIIDVNDLFCVSTKLRYVDAMKGIINPLQNTHEDMSIVWDALNTDFIYKDRQVFKLKNKEERIIDVTVVALINDKEVVEEYLVFSDDVTEIINSKRKIKNQELDNRLIKLNYERELNKVKDSFLTIFTHELKTPLNSIINFSEYVKKHLKKEKFTKRDLLIEHIGEINSSGFFMLEMINNLMEAIKLRETKVHLNISHVNVKNTLDKLIYKKDNNKKITLICDEKFDILSDDLRFTQILKHIFSNAIKYSNSKIDIRVREKSDNFFIIIEDDGKGFSNIEKIFDIFEQADSNSMTRESTGTGVGLYIVKQLCDRMHYTIKIGTSKKLGGAKVIVEGNRKIGIKKMNILIVDDNKNNRMILRLLLEDYAEDNKSDFVMDESEDGLEAVEMCEKKKYDIVFMDIMMPKMDGIEATRLIRQKNKKVLIIAVSAVDDSERQKLILSNGAEDYISKPVNSDIFVSRITNYTTLIHSREHTKINEGGINLFTKNIYSHYTKFSLSSEDALSELWEYFLLNSQEKYDDLSDIIRTVFSIAEIQLKLNIKSSLYVEDSEECKYFTIVNLDDMPSKIIELTLKKNAIKDGYESDGSKLSFELKKIVTVVEVQESVKSQEDSAQYIGLSNYDTVFDYIDPDDMLDLEEYSARLSSLMLIVGSGDVTEDELVEMYTYIDKLGVVLSTYSEVYVIARALAALAADMAEHADVFIENSEALGPLCTAFSKDFTTWVEQSFHTGAPSVDFMNATIVVNCQTIGNMLKMDNEATDNFDDIFDF